MKYARIGRYVVALAFISTAIIMAFDINGMQYVAPSFDEKMTLQFFKIAVLFLGLILAAITLIVAEAGNQRDEKGLITLSGRWFLGVLLFATLLIGLWRSMQAIIIASLVGLVLVLLPRLFEDLAQRVERLGPIALRPPVSAALQSVPAGMRDRAQQEAKQIDERLRASMRTWQAFFNALRAEIAALAVRITALEEEYAALRARFRE